MEKIKKNWYLLIIGLATVALGVVAVVTALKLYQVGKKPVAPTAPESKPQAVNPDCSLTFNIAGPTETPTPPTGTQTPTPPTGTLTPTPTSPTSTPTPTGTLTPTPTRPTSTPTPTSTLTLTPTPTAKACGSPPPQDPPTAWCENNKVCVRWAWRAVTGATQYQLEVRDSQNNLVVDTDWQDPSYFTWDGTFFRYEKCGLNSGETYRSRVGARGFCADERWSEEESVSKTCVAASPTPTPTPTEVALPLAGFSLPTWGAILAGILTLGLALLLAF